MKKILALALCLVIGIFSSVSVFATYTDSNESAYDDLAENFVAYNNFENCASFELNSYSVVDSGEEGHGYVLKNSGTAWNAIETKSYSLGTYTYNNKTYNMFAEPIEPNTDYILSFDYKYLNSSSNLFSFALKVPKFSTGTDYRHSVPYSAEWVNYYHTFNSGSETKVPIKINTLFCTAGFYIDNYIIREAKTITVNSEENVLPMILSGKLYDDKYLAKGDSVSFKAPKGFKFAVSMGEENITPVNGIYSISSVKEDIIIDVEHDYESLLKAFYLDGKTIKLPVGYSVSDFTSRCETSENIVMNIIDSENNARPVDEYVSEGDKFADFTFEYMADSDGNAQYTVSEIVKMIDVILNNNGSPEEYDISLDRVISVSDAVLMRNIALKDKKYVIDETKLNNEKQKIVSDSSKYGITDEMLEDSVANIGNRTRIANVMKKALNGESITIATLGGSITEGDKASDKTKTCYAALVRDWWQRMFPGQVEFVNAGISGTNSNFGIYRLYDDVLKHDPDFLIVEYAVNDGSGTGSFAYCHEAIIREALENNCAVMQLFMTSNNTGYNCGQATHGPTGEHYGVPQVSMKDALYGRNYVRSDGQTFVFWDANNPSKSILADGTHPNDTGYAMTATLINHSLNAIYENLNNIITKVSSIPETKYMLAPLMQEHELVDPATHINNSRVEVVSLGGFTKNKAADSYRSNIKAMYGVNATSTNIEPMVIKVNNCHAFIAISETNPLGLYAKVEAYDAQTGKLLSTDTSQVNTQYGSKSIRTHHASFESIEGQDVVFKITPYVSSKTPSGANACILRSFAIA